MEIFGLIVMLIVAAFAQIAQVKLFFIAGIVAVACGLAGDVMNDFGPAPCWAPTRVRSGSAKPLAASADCPSRCRCHVVALVTVYESDALAPDKSFVAARGGVVATMVSGIPSVPWFAEVAYRRHRHVLAWHSGHDDRPGRADPVLPPSLTRILGSCVKLAYDKWSRPPRRRGRSFGRERNYQGRRLRHRACACR
ncbi:MAG: hypothetical protein ACLU7D_04480 [Collinsella sp.]